MAERVPGHDTPDLIVESFIGNELRLECGDFVGYFNVADLLEAILAEGWISQPVQVREVLSKGRLRAGGSVKGAGEDGTVTP